MSTTHTSLAYRVEPRTMECSCCGRGGAVGWCVVDLDDVDGGTVFGDKCEAEEHASALNAAFQQGWDRARAPIVGSQD